MAARNIGAIGKQKPIPAYAWIPPKYSPEYKIEVTRSDGTIDNITDVLFEGEIINGATDFIGNFSFVLDNSAEQYTGIWIGNEVLKQYSDYETAATTGRFRGRIEKITYQDNKVRITGRSESLKLLDIYVNYSDSGEASAILKSLFDDYATDFTYTNVNTSTTNIIVHWYQKPLLECIQEICLKAGFDFYIDVDLDVHFFESGSVRNTNEAVVHGMNLLSVEGFGEDYSGIKNVVSIEGGGSAELPILYTSEDTGSTYGTNSSLGSRRIIIKDENVVSSDQAKERADAELSASQSPITMGEIECIGLATIQPGEQVRISAPDSNLPPNFYKIISYKHSFVGGMRTRLITNKEPVSIQEVIKQRISHEKDVNVENRYGMEFSWNFDFDLDSGVHESTEITDGVLKTDGSASGTWISELLETNANIVGVEMRLSGTSLAGIKGYLSTNGGVSYTQIYGIGGGMGSLAVGKKLKIRMNLDSANTQVQSLALLYK